MSKIKYTADSLLNTDEVAEFFNVKTRSIEDWVSQKRLPYFKLGWRSRRFRFSDVEKFLNEALVPARPSQLNPKHKKSVAVLV